MLFTSLLSSLLSVTPAFGKSDSFHDAVYTLPPGPTLKKSLSFAFEESNLLTSANDAKLVFRLPALLEGPKGRIFTLNGRIQNERIQLIGNGAKAECLVTESQTNCQISFEALNLNTKAAEQFEIDSGASILSEDLKLGREVFEHQAVGTITILHDPN